MVSSFAFIYQCAGAVPTCGPRNLLHFTLGYSDRCAINTSLHLPQAALRCLLPLHSSRRLRSYIIHYSVNVLNLVAEAV